MLFAIVLGVMLGAAAVTLLHQWAAATFSAASAPALTATTFPRLAPPERPGPSRHLARQGLHLRRAG